VRRFQNDVGDTTMALQSLYAGISLLGLLSSAAIASTFNDSVGSVKTIDAVELIFTCETSHPLLSLRWDDGDNTKASEIASAFLDVSSVTPRVIMDKVKECFSTLRSEQGMAVLLFDNVQLRCGIGPDIKWGRIVVGHTN
jgi:hypothetical protein